MKNATETDARLEQLLERMTLDQKLLLCHGRDALNMGGIPELGIPAITMFDGPQGVRLEDGRTATALPCGMALAATWDVDAAREFGALIGRECRGAGGEVSLGPGINLMRTPLNGRNFEYYGEDPVLAGKIAGGYIDGCRDERVAAMPKHLALNNQEICRTTSSSEADERTLRELYLAAFEYVVRHHQPWAMMSSYNRIHGVYASACGHIQQEIIKDEYGFDGAMVSDWCAVHDAKAAALNGLDIEMGNGMESPFGEPLKKLVETGAVPMAVIDDKVRRVLRMFLRVGAFDPARPHGELDTPRHHRIARKIAARSMTLLKNENHFLPLSPAGLKRIAVIGPNADYQHCMGPLETIGGSGGVHPAYEITPLAGVRETFGATAEILYAPGIHFSNDSVIPSAWLSTPDGQPGLNAEYYHHAADLTSGRPPFFSCRDTQMAFRWGAKALTAGGSDGTHDGQIPLDEYFAIRWSGLLNVPTQSPFRLMIAQSRGYAVVRIDGRVVIDQTQTGQAGPLVQGAAELQFAANSRHTLEIEFYRTRIELTEFKLLLDCREDETRGIAEAVELARHADVVIYVGGNNHRYDRECIGGDADLPDADIPGPALPGRQSELIQALAKVNPRLVVALIHGSMLDVEAWIDQVPAVLSLWYPGQEGGRALADVLSGAAEPGGRLPFSWARRLESYPCHANGAYPGTRGDLSADPKVFYPEGVFIGYRHFDRAPEELRFPFGFGLGYTDFESRITGLHWRNRSAAAPELTVSVTVRNIGRRPGATVLQLYLGATAPSLPRPVKELRDFRKVRLPAGESAQLEFKLNRRDFAFFDAGQNQFRVEAGPYFITVGYSSQNIIGKIDFQLEPRTEEA